METRKNWLIVLGEEWAARQATPAPRPNRVRAVLRWLMPNGGTLLLALILVLTQGVWARPTAAPNAPGPSTTTVNYQGRLADSSGVPITGTRGMTFALYDALTGGNLIWGPESHTAVPVSDGLFSVGLGSQTAGGIPTSAWNGDRYLQITVGGETLSPRELLRGVPVAGMALTVPDGAIGSSQIADGAVTQSKAGFPITEPFRPSLGDGGCHNLIAHLQSQGFTRCVYASSPGSGAAIWYYDASCADAGREEPGSIEKYRIWWVLPEYPVYIKGDSEIQMPYLICQ